MEKKTVKIDEALLLLKVKGYVWRVFGVSDKGITYSDGKKRKTMTPEELAAVGMSYKKVADAWNKYWSYHRGVSYVAEHADGNTYLTQKEYEDEKYPNGSEVKKIRWMLA